MELTLDQIQPFLSERGQLELELAAMRFTITSQNEVIRNLTAVEDVVAEASHD
jgi:hypothetical protein